MGTGRGYQRALAGCHEDDIEAGYGGGVVQCGAEEVGARI
jgi:hypothetical protein